MNAMGKKKSRRRRASTTRRVSVTFPADHYAELTRIAERKRVSVAWVVRDAVEDYLAAEAPLFRSGR